jgi:hypothetical protein
MTPAENPAPPSAPSPGPRPPGKGHHWAWAGAVVFIAFCLLAAFAITECSPGRQAGEFAGASAAGLARLAAALKQENIVQTFREHLASIQPDLSGRLLVADVKANEEFSEEDSSLLGTTSATIRAPVQYYYYVALGDPWFITINTTPAGAVTCLVGAPAIHALPSPAIDTSRLEIKSENGWLRWDKADVTARLLREISPKVSARAAQQLPQFLPQARESVEKFVREWILKQYQLPPNTPVFIQVLFLNESGRPIPSTPEVAR